MLIFILRPVQPNLSFNKQRRENIIYIMYVYICLFLHSFKQITTDAAFLGECRPSANFYCNFCLSFWYHVYITLKRRDLNAVVAQTSGERLSNTKYYTYYAFLFFFLFAPDYEPKVIILLSLFHFDKDVKKRVSRCFSFSSYHSTILG